MAEYIEREAFIQDIQTEIINLSMDGMKGTRMPHDELYSFIDRIKEQPAADVVPVVQGKWNIFFEFPGGACWKCSVCGRVIEAHNLQNPILRFPYCHCGAKMESAYIIAGTDLEESK